MPKVMLVDDDPTMVSLLRTLLELDGLDVADTTNWESIPDDVRAENPDLVLMDCILPVVDGVEVLAQIRSMPELEGMRVVMTSGMDMEDQCFTAGADAFLLKPYSPDLLIETIRGKLKGDGSRP